MYAMTNLEFEEDTFHIDQNSEGGFSEEPRKDSYREGPRKTSCDLIGRDDNNEKTSYELLEESISCYPRSAAEYNTIDLRKPREDIKQIWDGVVTDLNDQEFTVKLEDKTNISNPNELVVLSIDEIDARDRDLIKVGAMLLWHIGYRDGPRTPRERFSKIKLRRLPAWTEEEILSAEQQAEEYANFFQTDTNNFT